MFQKKSYPVKIKINYHTQALKNQKKKIRKKKKDNITTKVAAQGREKKEKKMQLKLRVFV